MGYPGALLCYIRREGPSKLMKARSQSIHEVGLELSNFHVQDSADVGPVHLSDKHTTLHIPT
jgi:hypothetical protein